ncbi:MAG TPA: hypothetical protein DD738_09925, partial [Ruminiclostridium sp.]|nr:hypothetical protein [Ruminiclostridium sp.]
MPLINRVRIINFSYNNDARYILDETFDFHGGENALLNLANGGGKSVLVQLMLQPIVPRAKIQNRSIAEFFKKKRTPSYILLEWKLDEKGGYLLTGIALAPVESRSAEDEEKSRIRLFCFFSRYSQSDGYDLSHIQLVRHEDGMIHVTPYKQAQEMMQEASRKDPLNCSYFPQDELEEHRRKLSQFGISQDEWKHIMIRINDSEGGLEEIFSKCRTSDQLLNDWLIRTIEKGLAPSAANNPGNDKELQQMFENLLNETINSEEYLKEKQILLDFTPGFGEVKNMAAGLAAVLDAKNETESELSAMHNALGEKGNATLRQLDEIEARLENFASQTRHIDREEYSDLFYQASEKYEQAHQKNLSAQLDKEQAEERLIQIKERLSMMRGARLKEDIDAWQAKITALKSQINLVAENTETADQINQLKASLLISLEQRLKIIIEEKEALEAELNRLLTLHDSQKERQKELLNRVKRLRSESNELQKFITIFESDESRLCRDLGIELIRNLLRELSEKDIVRTRIMLEKQITESDQKLNRLRTERENLESRMSSLNQEYEDASSNQSEQSNLLKDIQWKLKEYYRLTDEFKQVLSSNGLSPRDEKSVILAQLEKSQVELHSRISQGERALHNLLALTEDLRSGRYHIQGEWIDYLVDANIPFQTGEDYLRGINGSDRVRLLYSMPLLPYSIILTPDDLARLPENLDDRVQRSIIPFITYDVLKEVLINEKAPEAPAAWNSRALISSAKTGPDFLLAALFNRDALDPESAQALADKIINQSESRKSSLENLREAEKKLSKDIFIINAYPYEPGWETLHLQQEQQIQNKIQQLENLKATTKQKKSACEARLKELTGAIPKAENECSRHREHLSLWNNHINKNTEFERSCRKLADNQQSITNTEEEETALQNEIAELLSEKIPNKRQTIANKEKELLGCKDKYILYEGSILPEGLGYLEDSITVMEARLEALVANQGKELSELEQTLRDCSDQLKKGNKDFGKLHLPADVVLPVYNEMAEEELERQEELVSKERDKLYEKSAETDKNAAVTK